MSTPRVLSVGQCGLDQPQIARFLAQQFRAEVHGAGDAVEALEALRRSAFHLVLVNRVLDRDGSSGLELIRRIRAQAPVPVMLVSNYPDAQQEAVAEGALPGFGKAELRTPKAIEALAAALQKPVG